MTFYQKNTYLLEHDTNVTFEKLLWMSNDDFCQWCIELREAVVYAWNTLGIPPRVGYNEDEIIEQFQYIGSFPVQQFLIKDQLTGNKDVIKNTRIEGNAVNQWFPSMMKTPINYTTDKEKGKSIYDFFFRDDLLYRFITYASRHFKRDSFYHYSLPVQELDTDFSGSLPVADNGMEWILKFETSYRQKGEYDYWLCPFGKDRAYSGHNSEINNRKFLSVNDNNVWLLRDICPLKCQTNLDYKETDHYHIRAFKLGQKIFPIGFKAFRISFSQYATNFPSLTAKLIYEKYTHKGKKNIVWDPSMGWGGRLVGALSVRDDRHITYLGNDPNTDHIVSQLAVGKVVRNWTKYHCIYQFYIENVRKGGLWEEPHNDFRYWCLGSEDMQYDGTFRIYKGNVDLVFTSPPYFMKEAYSDDPTQSYNKFSNYGIWKQGFLYETLKTAYEWLTPGGHLCWNISDVKFGSEILPLIEDSIEICIKLGFDYVETLKMCLAAMPGGNRIDNGVPKFKHYVQVDGRYHKYEPCLVFKKPQI